MIEAQGTSVALSRTADPVERVKGDLAEVSHPGQRGDAGLQVNILRTVTRTGWSAVVDSYGDYCLKPWERPWLLLFYKKKKEKRNEEENFSGGADSRPCRDNHSGSRLRKRN